LGGSEKDRAVEEGVMIMDDWQVRNARALGARNGAMALIEISLRTTLSYPDLDPRVRRRLQEVLALIESNNFEVELLLGEKKEG
jgi:hypothetical protein